MTTIHIQHISPEVASGDNSFSVETESGYIVVECVKGRNDAVNVARAHGYRVLSAIKIED